MQARRDIAWPGQGHAPGSDKALDAGCQCPVLDNAHGRGAGGMWWIGSDCKLHAGKDAPWGDPRFPWDDTTEQQHKQGTT